MPTINFNNQTIGAGTFSSASRYRRNASGLLQLVAANTPRYQYGIDGLVEGILLERAYNNDVRRNRDLTASVWTKSDLVNISTARTSIISGGLAQEWGEGVAASTHLVNASLATVAADVPDATAQTLWALVEYVNCPFVHLTYKDKASNFPFQRFNINPETAGLGIAASGGGTQHGAGIEYYGKNVFLVWGSWSSLAGASSTNFLLGMCDAGGTTNNYTGTSRSFIVHATGSVTGDRIPDFYFPIDGSRLTKVTDLLSYVNPTITNNFSIDLTFIARSPLLATRTLLRYGGLRLSVDDSQILAFDFTNSKNASVPIVVQQGSEYRCSIWKGSDGLFLSVNGVEDSDVTDTLAIADGTVFVGSDAAGSASSGLVIKSVSFPNSPQANVSTLPTNYIGVAKFSPQIVTTDDDISQLPTSFLAVAGFAPLVVNSTPDRRVMLIT